MAKDAKTPARLLLVLAAVWLFSADTCWAAVDAESTHYYEDARAYLKKGDVNAAIIQLKNAIRADERNVDARFDLASIFLARLDGANAEKELRAALAHGITRERALLPLAQALLLQNKADALIKEIDPAATRGNDAALLHALRARANLMLKQWDEAESEIEKSLVIQPKSGTSLVILSQVMQSKGKFAEAEKAVDQALAANPDLVDAHVQKGALRNAQGDFTQAVAEFDRALSLDPKSASALLGRAQANLSLGKLEKARLDVDAALRGQPGNALASYFDAFLLSRNGKYQEAIERLQRIAGFEEFFSPVLYLNGSLNLAVGNLERARESAEKYVSRVPNSVPGKTLLAAIQLRQGQPQKVIDELQPIVTAASEDFNVITLLATGYMMTNQPVKAAELFDRALKLKPDSVAIQLELAKAHLTTGDNKLAESELERIVAASPDSAGGSALLVVSLLSNQQLDEADKAARAFRDRAANNPLPRYLQAAVALARKDVDGGRQYFEDALKVDPNFAPAALGLAALDIEAGRQADAKRRYEEVITGNPNSVPALLGLAQLAIKERNNAAALSWLDKAADADPKDLRARIAKVDFLMATGQGEQAVSAARDLERSAPNNPVALQVLGRAQSAAGDKESAIEAYRRLVALAPDSAEAHYQLGEALRQSGKLDEAAHEFDAATAITPTMLDAWRARADIKRKVEGIAAARALAASLSDRIGLAEAQALEGDLLFAEGKFAEAAEMYRSQYKEQASTRAVLSLSTALSKAGQNPQALAILTDWLASHPDDKEVRFALSTQYIQSGKLDEARLQSEQLLSTAPNYAPNLNNLAWLYDQKGDTEKALDMRGALTNYRPNSPRLPTRLAGY